VLAPLLVGLVLTAAFCARGLRIPRPLLDMRLYANPGFSAAAVTTLCLGAVLLGGMILMPLYFQDVRGESPLLTGVLLIPQGVGVAAAMWVAGRLTDRIGAGVTTLIGGAINLAGTVPFVMLGARTSLAAIAGFMLVRGMGIGLSAMPAMTAAFRALGPAQINDAAPQLNVLQRIGGSIGTALLAVVLQQGLNRAGKAPAREAAAFAHTFIWVLIVTAVGVLPVFLLIKSERAAARATAAGTDPAASAAAGAAAMESL
jgi:Na+/melibiose symporter-like transporter